MKSYKFIYFILTLSLCLSLATSAKGASATGQISMVVIKALVIQVLANMSFPSSAAGSPEVTINPDDEFAGKFIVQGEENTSVTIRLPSEVYIFNSSSENPDKIKIHNFKANLGQTGIISSEGFMNLSVGATRAALSPLQKEGVYSGTYSVEVIY